MTCPSCGGEAPPGDDGPAAAGDPLQARCPRCGAWLAPERRLSLASLKWAAVLLALAGVAALAISASHPGAPLVRIGQIGATLNLAYVRISGTVAAPPAYDPDSGLLSFRVGDGTGDLVVSADRPATQMLIAAGRIPAQGDQVSLEGTIRWWENFTALALAAPERLTIQRGEPAERPIGAITAEDDGRLVMIRGQVREVRAPHPGLKVYALRDASGEIDVLLSADTVALTGDPPALAAGDAALAIGVVILQRGGPHLSLTSARNLQPLDSALGLAARRLTGSLTAADKGALVLVVGTLAGPERFPAGTKFALDDGTGAISLLLWDDLYAEIGELSPGSTVQVVGSVDAFREAVELIPAAAADVKVLTAAQATALPTVAPNPTATPLPACPQDGTADLRCSPIAGAAVGQTITVQGQVVLVASYAGGFKFALRDRTGTITLLLPEAVYSALPDPQTLRPGALVRATGLVGAYRGDLEIRPAAASDVFIVAPGTPPDELPIAIGRIGLGDVNATLTVEGRVTAVETFSRGLRVTVSDDSGSITLLLWQNVLNYVPAADRLEPGMPVRATGKIQEYRGALEIVPQIGFDVVLGGLEP